MLNGSEPPVKRMCAECGQDGIGVFCCATLQPMKRTVLLVLLAALYAAGLGAQAEEVWTLLDPVALFESYTAEDLILVDVRSRASWEQARVAGSLSLPYPELASGASSVLRSGRIPVLYCTCPNEITSVAAARELQRLGAREVIVLVGGLRAWATAGLPMAFGPAEDQS